MDNSDSEDECVIRYGTPLEPYEEDEVPSKRKYQQPTDQYAVDSNGRRRFHGAFTGGFSAGFGNTVGTPEGWTPATFKSSRSDKAQHPTQRPEDFMDDEDRGEFGIAPRHMETHSEFSGQKRTRQQRYHDGPIPGVPVLENLVRAVHETAAVKMLKAMGWREGQGTGDRLTRNEKKKAKEQHKVYGCYMPPEMQQNNELNNEDSSDSEFDYDTLFAPDDYEPYILNRKNDRFGLGYSGLSRHSVLGNLVGEYGSAGTSKSHLMMKDKGKRVSIRGQAFGVGAFEADDEDIYSTEDMSHYDFAIGGVKEQNKPKKPDKDRGVLEGFVVASRVQTAARLPPAPPAPPRHYSPAVRRSRFEPSAAPRRDQGLGRHELSAEARGSLLGETPLQPPKLPSPIPTTQVETQPNSIKPQTNNIINFVPDKTELDYIPIKDSGKELVKVFKPFASNPQKQTRYEMYLKDKDSIMLDARSTDKLSEWERNREMSEFEQAAKLYKPLSGVMGDRFTHASQPDDAINPLIAVAKSTTNYGIATPEQIEAAAKGLFGVMTRRQTEWRPQALVCKRFNIPEIGGSEPVKEDKPKVSYSIFSYLESSVHDKDSFAKEQTKFSGSKSLNRETLTARPNKIPNQNKPQIAETSKLPPVDTTGFNKRMTVAELFLKESEKDLTNAPSVKEVTETINKFDKMDLYKSIFLSDSEDEVTEGNSNTAADFTDVPKNIERNTSPPRGIFANIDFDELNSWRRDKVPDKPKTPPQTKSAADEEINDAAVYGPSIPENLKKRIDSSYDVKLNSNEVLEVNSSSSDSWVDANEVKSKKLKKKKSKKHKSKHKKTKHKKKTK